MALFSLAFSGGFDLAANWCGWTNLFTCEIDDFCNKVLEYHFKDAKHYRDIRNTDFTEWKGKVDITLPNPEDKNFQDFCDYYERFI